MPLLLNKRAADTLSERLAILFNTPVAVVDQRDVVVASSDRANVGLPRAAELRDTFVYYLLCGPPVPAADVLRQAQILSLDLTTPRVVLLADIRDFVLRPQIEKLIQSIQGFFAPASDPICSYLGG